MTELELRGFNVDVSNNGLKGKSLPKSIKILEWGKNDTTDGPVYLTKQTLAVFAAYQKKTGRDVDVALDFDHSTVPGSKEYVAGQPKAIAAYGNPVLKEGDGLYLDNLEWTPLGVENAKNYKDLSPAAVVDKEGVVVGLHSAALTPNGAVYKLKFYSAKGFDDMITKMSSEDYNYKGANAGVKKVGNSYIAITKPLDVGMMDANEVEHDENNPKCMCKECSAKLKAMSADGHKEDCMCAMCVNPDHVGAHDGWNEKEHKAHKDLVKDFAADDDHYSKYGDVKYADEANHKYPVDTEKHVRAAWSYINMPKNAKKEAGKLSEVKSMIKSAAKKFGIEISDESADEQKTKTMSANNPSFPDAYKAQIEHYNSMNDTIIKKMAVEVGMEGESDEQKVLFAFLAKYEGLKAEIDGQITKKENTEEGGLKQFSTKFEALENEIKMLKTHKVEVETKHNEFERQTLINQASKEGKIIPLSADQVKTVDVEILRSIITNQPKNIVPLTSTMRVLSVDSSKKPSRDTAVSAFDAMLKA